MKNLVDKLTLDIINIICNKKGRKPSQNNIHYLKTINYILKNGSDWNTYEGILDGSTYKKKFYYWTKCHIFELAYKYIICILEKLDILNYDEIKHLFMDSTNIRNLYGIESIGRCYADKNKNATKINVIVSKNGIPLSITIHPGNISDAKLLEPTLENINIKIIGSRKKPIYLGADQFLLF